MSKIEQILQKIEFVIFGADQFKDEQFRQVLEGLVKKGGKEAEFLLAKNITADDIPAETKINIIRCAGDIQNIMYLMPLKKAMDTEPDINVKKAAILAIARYNNEKALNILDSALQTVTNQLLHKLINEKITTIKQTHPVLALLPRFLKGSQDLKACQVALGILKKNLKPDEAKSFLKYMDSKDLVIRKGVFEILCSTGDDSLHERIFTFYGDWAANSPCLAQPQCDEIHLLTLNLRHYLDRFPSLVNPQCPMMKSLFSKVADLRVKKQFINIFCRCKSSEAFAFMREIYEQGPELRETIIEQSAGNPQAVDFLFEKYQAGKLLKEKVVGALLHSDEGLNYFITHFPSFETDHREMIVRNLPYSDRPVLNNFIETLLKSDAPGDQNLKKYLLNTIGKNYVYSFKQSLFDPQKDSEFFSMEDEYLAAIFKVFPTAASKKLLKKIGSEDLDLRTTKKYLGLVLEAAQNELIISIGGPGDDKRTLQLTTRIININNLELTEMFLSTLALLKTFDLQTYRNISDALNYFLKVKTKDDNVPEEEKIGVRKVRENLKGVLDEIRKIETIEKDIKLILQKTVPDVMQLKRLIMSEGTALAFKIKPLTAVMVDYFRNMDDSIIARWRAFFKELPLVTRLVREGRIKAEQTQPTASNHRETLHEKLKIVISFQDKDISTLFRDQFQEILPDLKLALEGPQELHLDPIDALLCDSDTLRDIIKQKKLNTKRIFVLLKNREEFNVFKNYNPRSFLSPISVYRTFKLILQELYLPK